MLVVTDGTPATTKVFSGLEVRSMLKAIEREGSKSPEGADDYLAAVPVMPPALEAPPPPAARRYRECCPLPPRRTRRWGSRWHPRRAAKRPTGRAEDPSAPSTGSIARRRWPNCSPPRLPPTAPSIVAACHPGRLADGCRWKRFALGNLPGSVRPKNIRKWLGADGIVGERLELQRRLTAPESGQQAKNESRRRVPACRPRARIICPLPGRESRREDERAASVGRRRFR